MVIEDILLLYQDDQERVMEGNAYILGSHWKLCVQLLTIKARRLSRRTAIAGRRRDYGMLRCDSWMKCLRVQRRQKHRAAYQSRL